MIHLKSFNEENRFSDIDIVKDLCSKNLAYLLDEGFTYNTDLDITANENEFLLYINGTKDVTFNEILPDLIPFVELLLEIVDIKDLDANFYFKKFKNNPYEIDDNVNFLNYPNSRVYREKIKIDNLLNGEFKGNVYNIPGLLKFSFILTTKKKPFRKTIKSFFSKIF